MADEKEEEEEEEEEEEGRRNASRHAMTETREDANVSPQETDTTGVSGVERSAFRLAEHLYKLKLRERKKQRGGKRRSKLSHNNDVNKSKRDDTMSNITNGEPFSCDGKRVGANNSRVKGYGVKLIRDHIILSEAILRGDIVPAGGGIVHCETARGTVNDENNLRFQSILPSGVCILRSFVPVSVQMELIRECLERFPNPPATNNYQKTLGVIPPGMFLRSNMHDMVLVNSKRSAEEANSTRECVRDDLSDGPEDNSNSQHGSGNTTSGRWMWMSRSEAEAFGSGEGVQVDRSETVDNSCVGSSSIKDCHTAKDIMRKLRWVAIGPPYDWTNKRYRTEPCCSSSIDSDNIESNGFDKSSRREDGQKCSTPLTLKLPQILHDIALAAVAASKSTSSPSSNEFSYSHFQYDSSNDNSTFHPNAALVNYYSESDCLMGHVDQSERDLTKPLVALSLGCPAIFLLGSKVRSETPHAMILRSGDVVVLSGQSRQCFHGVPRIFTPQSNVDVRWNGQSNFNGDDVGMENSTNSGYSADGYMPLKLTQQGCPPDFKDHAKYLSESRISISIRDVN